MIHMMLLKGKIDVEASSETWDTKTYKKMGGVLLKPPLQKYYLGGIIYFSDYFP